MTNLEIIANAIEVYDIHEYVDTYAGWLRHGYQVKKHEHAKFKTKIWRPVKKQSEENTEEHDENNLILVNASFFGESQVEPI